jgi:hypothetical protein
MDSIQFVIPNGNPKCYIPKVELTVRQALILLMLCNRYTPEEIRKRRSINEANFSSILLKLYDLCGIDIPPGHSQRHPRQLAQWAIDVCLVDIAFKDTEYGMELYRLSNRHRVSQLKQLAPSF